MWKRLMPLCMCMAVTITQANDIIDLNASIMDTTTNTDMVLQDSQGLGLVQQAFDGKDSITDSIIRYNYNNGTQIFKVRLRTRIGTVITIPEIIETFVLGDSAGFSFSPLNSTGKGTNKGVVYASVSGVDTNLNIMGKSGRIYSLYLRADNEQSAFIPHFVVHIVSPVLSAQSKQADTQPKAPKDSNSKIPTKNDTVDFVQTKPDKVDVTKVSYGYKQKGGNVNLMPLQIFDDGVFTYFQFSKTDLVKTQSLPVIYRSVSGKDYPVNSRIDGGFVIVERTSTHWTLRLGKDFACVTKQQI